MPPLCVCLYVCVRVSWSRVQVVRARREALTVFLGRLTHLSATLARLLRELALGAPSPEQLSDFCALLERARASVEVHVCMHRTS